MTSKVEKVEPFKVGTSKTTRYRIPVDLSRLQPRGLEGGLWNQRVAFLEMICFTKQFAGNYYPTSDITDLSRLTKGLSLYSEWSSH